MNQAQSDPDHSKIRLNSLSQAIFFVAWPFFILSLLLPVYGKEIGASVLEIGLFFSVFSLMNVLLRPLVGWAIDLYGRRPFFILGLGIYALTMIGFAFIEQVWGVLIVRVFQGIASAFLWLSAYAIIADIAKAGDRGKNFGRIIQSSTRGAILGTFVGFTLLNFGFEMNMAYFSLESWEILFLVYALVSLGAMIFAMFRLQETNKFSHSASNQRIQWSRPWILLLLVTLVTGASWSMVSPILIIYLQEQLNVGIQVLSWAFLPAALVWAILPVRFGRLADRYGRKPLMLVGLGMAAISSFIIPGLSTVIGFTILWAFQAMCYAAGDPAEQALVADLTGGDQRGRAYGFYAMAADLVQH